MRSVLFFIAFIAAVFLFSCHRPVTNSEGSIDELYDRLDAEIARSDIYELAKTERIAGLRADLESARPGRRPEAIESLIEEYTAYQADSALYYIGLGLREPSVVASSHEFTRLQIRRADVYAHAGLFADGLAIMRAIPRDSLAGDLLEVYYATYWSLYQYLCEYTDEHETSRGYEILRKAYSDSLGMVVAPGSFNSLRVMTDRADKENVEQIADSISGYFGKYPSGTREYSILASTLAYIYGIAGDTEKSKRHLALSAISDIKGVVKENMSFRAMASVMFEEGDIKRANTYLKKSIADARFYSALMRNAQSAKILPEIDMAYSTMQDRLAGHLRVMAWISCILSCVLIVTIIFILRQFRSLRRANSTIGSANAQLSALSGELKDMNAELQKKNLELSALSEELRHSNDELRDFSRTKEQYAGLFMENCSSAISTLKQYQQSLRILAAQGAGRAALLKKIESSEIADQLLKNFYEKFDEAILNIYPRFVEKFNALLSADGKVTLRSGELLNTELRLFALIRIGIDDSAKIAQFLRCSISTVYTYRSKMRKRALDPDNFEKNVRDIG